MEEIAKIAEIAIIAGIEKHARLRLALRRDRPGVLAVGSSQHDRGQRFNLLKFRREKIGRDGQIWKRLPKSPKLPKIAGIEKHELNC